MERKSGALWFSYNCCLEQLVFLEELVIASFPVLYLTVFIIGGSLDFIVVEDTVVLFRGVLVLILSIAFWLYCRILNLLAQSLHPAGIDFLASPVDL